MKLPSRSQVFSSENVIIGLILFLGYIFFYSLDGLTMRELFGNMVGAVIGWLIAMFLWEFCAVNWGKEARRVR